MLQRVALTAILGSLLAFPLTGCGEGKKGASGGPSEGAKAEPEPAGPDFVVDPATAGSIGGRVIFDGKVPSERKITVEADPYCAQRHPEGLTTESAKVGHDGGVANVFVYVKKGIKGKFAVPEEAVLLDQVGCRYEPHVIGIRAGQTLKIRNSDETMHNVHALPKANDDFNFAQTPKQVMEKKFLTAEVGVKVKCDVHGWMSAYVCVAKHPYFQVTGESGAFELKNLPPGEYEIEAWHEKFGLLQETVKVGEKEAKTLTFTYKGE